MIATPKRSWLLRCSEKFLAAQSKDLSQPKPTGDNLIITDTGELRVERERDCSDRLLLETV